MVVSAGFLLVIPVVSMFDAPYLFPISYFIWQALVDEPVLAFSLILSNFH